MCWASIGAIRAFPSQRSSSPVEGEEEQSACARLPLFFLRFSPSLFLCGALIPNDLQWRIEFGRTGGYFVVADGGFPGRFPLCLGSGFLEWEGFFLYFAERICWIYGCLMIMTAWIERIFDVGMAIWEIERRAH
jgi:hypothetical protein